MYKLSIQIKYTESVKQRFWCSKWIAIDLKKNQKDEVWSKVAFCFATLVRIVRSCSVCACMWVCVFTLTLRDSVCIWAMCDNQVMRQETNNWCSLQLPWPLWCPNGPHGNSSPLTPPPYISCPIAVAEGFHDQRHWHVYLSKALLLVVWLCSQMCSCCKHNRSTWVACALFMAPQVPLSYLSST